MHLYGVRGLTVRDIEHLRVLVGLGGVDDINVSADPKPFQNLIITGLLISIGFYLFLFFLLSCVLTAKNSPAP